MCFQIMNGKTLQMTFTTKYRKIGAITFQKIMMLPSPIMNSKKILILGVTGMLGHTLFMELRKNKNFDVYGTIRSINSPDKWFKPEEIKKIRKKAP